MQDAGYRKALFLLLILTCVVVSCSHKGNSPSKPNWRNLAESSKIFQTKNNFGPAREVEWKVFDHDPSSDDLADYVTFLLERAISRRETNYGDSYAFLVRAETLLFSAPMTAQIAELLFAVARELSAVHSYRRAFEILDRIPNKHKNQQMGLLEQQLASVFSLWRSGQTLVTTVTNQVEGRIQNRLIDLLGILPHSENELELIKVEASSSAPRQQIEPRKPFLLGLHNRNMGSRPAGYSGKTTLQPISLSQHEKNSLRNLLRGTAHLHANIGELANSHPALEIVRSKLPVEKFLSTVQYTLNDAWRIKGALVLTFQAETDWSQAVIVTQSPADEILAVRFPLIGAPDFQIRDVVVGNSPALVATGRSGSGGFLDAVIVRISPPKILWEADTLPRGAMRLFDLDEDDDLELVEIAKGDDGRSGCTQCPAFYVSSIYDYNRATETYELVGERTTIAEASINVYSSFGVGPHMYLNLIDEKAEPWIRKLSKSPRNTWSDELLGKLTEVLSNELALLEQVEAFGAAFRLLEGIAKPLEQKDLPEKWREFKLTVHFRRIYTSIIAREYQAADRLLAESWFLKEVESAKRQTYYNLRSMVDISLGKVDRAYEVLLKQRAAMDPDEAIEGNLALYFRIIGDHKASYSISRQALDIAVENQNTASQLLSLSHIGSAASNLGNYVEALDWEARVVKLGGRNSNYSYASTLVVSANIALKTGLTTLATELLDEAISVVDDQAWRSLGGAVLLLYARAVRVLGNQDLALSLLQASTKLSKSNDSSIYIATKLELSRIMYEDKGLFKESLFHAREGFNAITGGRKSLPEEPHKFAFLTDKNEVASWFFKLLIETGASAAKIVEAVESWKMQTFLDIYDKPNSIFDGITKASGVSSQLKEMLGDDEMFLEYVIGEKDSFVIVVSRKSEELIRLPITAALARSVINNVNDYMDIHNAQAVRDIRRHSIPNELRADLNRLYQLLMEPIHIPTKIRRLIIAPDGPLFRVPWPAIFLDGKEQIVDRYDVALVPSGLLATVLHKQAKKRESRAPEIGKVARALVVGVLTGVTHNEIEEVMPLTQMKLGRTLAPLTNGWTESQSVGQSLSRYSVDYLLDSQTLKKSANVLKARLATPENVLSILERSRIVHFTAHGVFNSLAPMRSALFLEPGNKGRVLQASDLSQRNLSQVELVTLAACQTAVSGVMPGAEPIGFLRSLLGAGVSTVILTGWEIDDKATSELFTSIYANLERETKTGALRSSQLKIRKRFVHPYFWAGITLYGYWN